MLRIAAIFFSLLVVVPAYSQQQGEDKKQPPKSQTTGTIEKPFVIKIAPTQKTKADAEQEREERDAKQRAEQRKQKNDDDLTAFTGQVADYTNRLFWIGAIQAFVLLLTWVYIWRQERNSRTHERAYIVCGGWFGQRKQPFTETRWPKKSDFKAPWRMVIHNFGRSPGFVTKVQWGVCKNSEFPGDKSVSKIIEEGKIKIVTVNVQEMFAPTGGNYSPLPYRHVQSNERKVGDVFFGKIYFRDIFGDEHFSTFAMLHEKEHTTPIGASFADDWK